MFRRFGVCEALGWNGAYGRGMKPADVRDVAEGRVWTGRQAVEHGLVDSLGTLDSAIDRLCELVKINLCFGSFFYAVFD